jgi:F-box protein, helicase, 18
VPEIASKYKCAYDVASNASKTLEYFFNSDLDSLRQIEVPDSTKMVATEIINDMRDGKVSMSHSFYLKEYEQMLKSGLCQSVVSDIVMLDEAQDSNPVTISILNHLGKKRVIVGDEHQQIYGFRLSINAMRHIEGKELRLTTTFRCSPEIVKRANWILQTLKGEKSEIISANNIINPPIMTEAYISRTNSLLIKFMEEIEHFNLTRKPELIFECALGVYYWSNKEFDKMPLSQKYLCNLGCKNLIELDIYANDSEDFELRKGIAIVTSYGHKLLSLYQKAKNNFNSKTTYPITLSTAHSVKGLEYDSVTTCDDMPYIVEAIGRLIADEEINSMADFYTSDNSKVVAVREEVNLYYVATTRAKYRLDDLSRNSENIFESTDDIWNKASEYAKNCKELMPIYDNENTNTKRH